jgi:hypothetical protein
LCKRRGWKKIKFPTGIAIFGSDDATGEIFYDVFYERKVSRKYEVSFEDGILNGGEMQRDFHNGTPGQ